LYEVFSNLQVSLIIDVVHEHDISVGLESALYSSGLL
jgi:hypothetical protein